MVWRAQGGQLNEKKQRFCGLDSFFPRISRSITIQAAASPLASPLLPQVHVCLCFGLSVWFKSVCLAAWINCGHVAVQLAGQLIIRPPRQLTRSSPRHSVQLRYFRTRFSAKRGRKRVWFLNHSEPSFTLRGSFWVFVSTFDYYSGCG